MFFKRLGKISLSPVFIGLFLSLLLSTSATAGPLKPTMKEMRLYYKQAIDTRDPAVFNETISRFLTELNTAREFKYSPERKALSLEGLNKLQTLVSSLPKATETNLSQLQTQLREADQLRIEYHKKVKPGVFELLLDTLKETLGL